MRAARATRKRSGARASVVGVRANSRTSGVGTSDGTGRARSADFIGQYRSVSLIGQSTADNKTVAIMFPRVNILGVGISAINLEGAVAAIQGWIETGQRHHVNVCTVHTVMECQKSGDLRHLVNHSGLSTPDGMPLVWLCRLHGHRKSARVYGPDLMLAMCDRGRARGLRHFFYGGARGVAELLAQKLQARFPGLAVAGTHAPPFRPADVDEDTA